jgi:toxin ParE1/3/4
LSLRLALTTELIERVGDLDQFARRGRVVPEIGLSAYREILHAPYRVIYRVDASRVLILTLRHSRRAWDPSEVADGP